MPVTSLGSGGALPSSIIALKAQLDALQTQMATGRKATTYGGLGSSRSLALGLRAEISQITSFKTTIATASLRLDVADTALQRIQEIADSTRSGLVLGAYDPSADGRTQAQFSAEAALGELVSLYNSQVSGHYLFSGRSATTPPVLSDAAILEGEGGRAGFIQALAERRLADLGASLAPSLVSVTGTGATASTPDAAATISSGALGADLAAIAVDSGDLGDSTDVLTGLGIADGDELTIDIGGTSFTVGFFDDGIGTGQDVVIDLDNGGPASGPADIAALAAALDGFTGANGLGTVTDNAGVLEFRPPAGAEYVRFTDGVGTNVADLQLDGAGYGTGAGDRLVTKNAALSRLAFEGATLEVGFGGATVGTVTFGTGAGVSNLAELAATIDAFAGVSASETGGVLTISTTNPGDTDSTIVLTGDSNSTLEVVLGYTPDTVGGAVATAAPTDLLSPANGLSQGDTLTIQIGSQPTTITFGTNPGEVSSLAELNAALGAIPNATASVVLSGPATGNISITADLDGDPVIIDGSPGTAARFGLTEGEFSDLALGRLSIPAAGAGTVTISEDAAGHPFGFKLTSVASSLTGTTVSGPLGAPPSVQVNFTATPPQPGEAIAIDVALPDGTSTKFRLTATDAAPPGRGEFTIGPDAATTAENFRLALLGEVDRVATSELAAASGIAAAADFFDFDATNPPQRVAGPPFETATGFVDATPADTVFWYQGDLEIAARDSAVARVDDTLSVSYGARADEAALRDVIKYVSLIAADRYDVDAPRDADRYAAMNERLTAGIGGGPQVRDIATELAQKHVVIEATDARHDEALTFAKTNIDKVEGADLEEVAASILRLQTQLQASFETTSILSRLTIVNFL